MDLEEYSSAKLDRVTRYLGVLAEKTRKLGEMCHFGLRNCVNFIRNNACWFILSVVSFKIAQVMVFARYFSYAISFNFKHFFVLLLVSLFLT